eukprot:TRINITY_DN23970_c1_g1_i2.p2 TRINITY_DN23970_c1_g1~~TRINITY_DN23970_c1_g1_i2.p2  ORF type:complete len:162 (-),score=30.44 TRINITY_DN23970_c1_g1_i2:147-632(-)
MAKSIMGQAEVLVLEGNGAASPTSSKPSFLMPAFDPTPSAASGLLAEPDPKQVDDGPEIAGRPHTPMVQPADSRPPSASGERSWALMNGFVKLSEVEATMRLNSNLEAENAAVEAEICSLLRQNLQLRQNITTMEEMLGISHEDAAEQDEEARPEASEDSD